MLHNTYISLITWYKQTLNFQARTLQIFTIEKQIRIDFILELISTLDQTLQKEHFKISNITMMLPSRNIILNWTLCMYVQNLMVRAVYSD